MRAETDPATRGQAGAAALGVEERSDENPRAEDEQERSAPDPELVAKPTRRQFTAEYRLRILEEADRCSRPGEIARRSDTTSDREVVERWRDGGGRVELSGTGHSTGKPVNSSSHTM